MLRQIKKNLKLIVIILFTSHIYGKDSTSTSKAIIALSENVSVVGSITLYFDNFLQNVEMKTKIYKSLNRKGFSVQDWKRDQNGKNLHLFLVQNLTNIPNSFGSFDSRDFAIDNRFNIIEVYNAGTQKIRNKIGHFNGSIIVPNNDVEQNLFKRRSNFFGVELTAMTEHWLPEIGLNKGYKDRVEFINSNNTYFVNNEAYGQYFEVLKMFEKYFNFTTRLYVRNDHVWGIPTIFENGSFEVDGMIRDLSVFGTADLVVAPLGMDNVQ